MQLLPDMSDATFRPPECLEWMTELGEGGREAMADELREREPYLAVWLVHRSERLRSELKANGVSGEIADQAADHEFETAAIGALMMRRGLVHLNEALCNEGDASPHGGEVARDR